MKSSPLLPPEFLLCSLHHRDVPFLLYACRSGLAAGVTPLLYFMQEHRRSSSLSVPHPARSATTLPWPLDSFVGILYGACQRGEEVFLLSLQNEALPFPCSPYVLLGGLRARDIGEG